MCPSSWKLCLDVFFSFFASSLVHLEPKLQLLEVNDTGNDSDDDLSHHHHLPNFKQL